MKICPRSIHRALLLGSLIGVLPTLPAPAQLAITEVLSAPATNTIQRADFWELTNFGTNAIDLSAYWFRDEGGFSGAQNLAELWQGRIDEPRIGPRESILFVRHQTDVTETPEQVREWWGDPPLRPGLRIVFYPDFGFSALHDAVQLWQVTPERTNLVDRVVLFESIVGATFTYDPFTGALDTFSAEGVNGAFRAATTTDVGSPGLTIGPVALRWVEAPVSREVDAGSPVRFSARAVGLPRPRYQWRFGGVAIPGATERSLQLPGVTSAHAGQYTAEISNGLETTVTPAATLTVNSQPRCATILRAPSDLAITPGQTAIFQVETLGFPLPSYRWEFNGIEIPGATGAVYRLAGAQTVNHGFYTVQVSNSLCSTNAGAHLKVVPVPKLVITEAMAAPLNPPLSGHDDWWELTNLGTEAVNLRGFRFDDAPGTLDGAVTVTNDVILEPGKSAIFVSSMTPEAFRRWWGEENLPAGMPILSYPGNGFSPSGDLARLWNATALTDDDWLVSKGFVNLEAGVSLWFDPDLAEFGEPSVAGQRGAFRAAESGDLGSPGWISNEQRVLRPRILSISRENASVRLTWRTEPGRIYELQYCQSLAQPDWQTLLALPAPGSTMTTVDPMGSSRFYRVTLLPLSP